MHGDDFVTVARQAGRDYTKQILSDAYEIKVDVAGPEPNDPKEIKILDPTGSSTNRTQVTSRKSSTKWIWKSPIG